jgi:dTDP-4-amino-4,6-dideoxygalactose transaminase
VPFSKTKGSPAFMASANTSITENPASAPTIKSATPQPMPFLDLKAQYARIKDEVRQAVDSVFESQHFILGREVQLLEEELAKYIGVPAAVGCASGSDALYLSLLALNIGPGDEVITTPFTFVATAGSIARTGAKPVFVDILSDSYNINPAAITSAITSRTKAIIPVHLFGLAADLDPIIALAQKHNLAVIEDAAQSIGATYKGRQTGSYALFGCFSFFPSKNLGCAGDGGLVTTTNTEQADRLKLLRAHGSRRKYHYEIIGTNSRLDALQAAILRVKLKHLDSWAKARQRHAASYRVLFADYSLTDKVIAPSCPTHCTHVYNQFVIRVPQRDALRAHLQQNGIPTDVYYPSPLHVQPAFAYLGYSAGAFPVAERAAQEVLALPVYPELAEQDQDRIVNAISSFFKSQN